MWCAGLKDAWTKLRLHGEDIEYMLDTMEGQFDAEMAEVPLAEGARVVAGAIRFARQNGLRLPEHLERAVQFLGAIDTDGADITAFGGEGGKLRWVGPVWDLRRRLIGCSVEEFLARPDVEAIADVEGEDDDADLDEADEDDLLKPEDIDDLVDGMAASVRDWCRQQDLTEEEAIEDAAALVLTAGLMTMKDVEPMAGDIVPAPAAAAGANAGEQLRQQVEGLLNEIEDESDRAGVRRAVEQVLAYLKTARELEPPEDDLLDDDEASGPSGGSGPT